MAFGFEMLPHEKDSARVQTSQVLLEAACLEIGLKHSGVGGSINDDGLLRIRRAVVEVSIDECSLDFNDIRRKMLY